MTKFAVLGSLVFLLVLSGCGKKDSEASPNSALPTFTAAQIQGNWLLVGNPQPVAEKDSVVYKFLPDGRFETETLRPHEGGGPPRRFSPRSAAPRFRIERNLLLEWSEEENADHPYVGKYEIVSIENNKLKLKTENQRLNFSYVLEFKKVEEPEIAEVRARVAAQIAAEPPPSLPTPRVIPPAPDRPLPATIIGAPTQMLSAVTGDVARTPVIDYLKEQTLMRLSGNFEIFSRPNSESTLLHAGTAFVAGASRDFGANWSALDTQTHCIFKSRYYVERPPTNSRITADHLFTISEAKVSRTLHARGNTEPLKFHATVTGHPSVQVLECTLHGLQNPAQFTMQALFTILGSALRLEANEPAPARYAARVAPVGADYVSLLERLRPVDSISFPSGITLGSGDNRERRFQNQAQVTEFDNTPRAFCTLSASWGTRETVQFRAADRLRVTSIETTRYAGSETMRISVGFENRSMNSLQCQVDRAQTSSQDAFALRDLMAAMGTLINLHAAP